MTNWTEMGPQAWSQDQAKADRQAREKAAQTLFPDLLPEPKPKRPAAPATCPLGTADMFGPSEP